ncbi:hypothetical protein AACH10_20520 [Ideonella sp. DXS22W]|uniref:Uncharacterized protein n=1 Tax=Pseudaquabacterium inlustre TaxID=2984192 RepID=A0ABU9CLF1_9BURK
MATADAPLLAQLLGIRPPWTVLAVLPSADLRVVTVQVGRQRPAPRFWVRREPPPAWRHRRWEHLPLLGQRCQVLLSLAPDEAAPEAPWTGEEGQQFSRALSRQVIDLLLAGATIEQLCVLLKLPVADLWRFKFRLEGGGAPAPAAPAQAGVATAASATRVPVAAVAAPPAPQPRPVMAVPATPVPVATSPLWRALLLGRVALEVRALSLRLLLSKLQREAALHQDADLHAQAAADLHRYVLRNQATLGHELAQLHALAQGADGGLGDAAARGALPAVTDPLWMELLQGQRALEVRALGLKLLLSKLRNQIDVIHDDEVRMVKLVELHRYFERNQAMLGHELAQIGRWHAH